MFANPVHEINSLTSSTGMVQPNGPAGGKSSRCGCRTLFHIKAVFKPQGAQTCHNLVIRDEPVVYDVAAKRLTCQGKSAALELKDGKITLEILVDRMSIEIYANGGRVYMRSELIYRINRIR